MWGNITGAVGAALQKVQSLQNELESQMDNAVGADGVSIPKVASSSSANLASLDNSASTNSLVSKPVDEKDLLPPREPTPVNRPISARSMTPIAVPDSKHNDAELANAVKELKRVEAEAAASAKKIKSLTAQLADSKNRLEQSVKSEESMKVTLDSVRKDKDLKDAEVNENKLNLEALAAELSVLKQNLKAAEEFNVAQEKSLREATEGSSQANEIAQEVSSLRRELLQKEQALNAAQGRVDVLEKSEAMHGKALGELKDRVNNQSEEINKLNATVATKTTEVSALLADCVQLREVVTSREAALESTNQQLAESVKARHDLTHLINDLKAELAGKDGMLKKQQSSSADEAEITRQLNKCLEQLKEKDVRLSAFEQEGQSLAKKHSDMEQIVRKTKAELKDRVAEVTKLKESKEQLIKAIEEQQEVIKKHETEVTSSTKNLSAMQAVSNASTERLTRLEADIASKVEELASQRRALENAWSENNEAKRTIAELKADRDDLRRQIGEGTSKVMETESYRRDIEQREAVLRATSKQLQDSLQRQMQEAAGREERLREEVVEMRKRWQDAVSSREAIASDLGSSTAPLLRQISTLQDSLRIKSENWQAIESSLSERALRAENKVEVLEHKKSMLEEQLDGNKIQLSSLTSRNQELQSQVLAFESTCEKLKRSELAWIEDKVELEAKLSAETVQRQSQYSSIRELEMRHKMDVKDMSDTFALQNAQRDLELSKLKRDNEQLSNEVNGLRSSSGLKSPQVNDTARHFTPVSDAAKPSSSMPEVLSNGELSFAGNERMQQRRYQQNEEMLNLQNQLKQLQGSRNALLEEVSYLSMRNSQLEESCIAVPQLQAEVQAKKVRIDLLLALLGEKEEELEAIMSDLKEVKFMYKSHYEELLEKVMQSSN